MKYPDLHAAIDKLHPGEPCFLLRAQDLLAPDAVFFYVSRLKQEGKVEAAKECEAFAFAMKSWQMDNLDKAKLPD